LARRFELAKYYTKKYSNILLPCRFCKNNDVHVVSERSVFPPKDVWAVVCGTCGDCTGDDTSVKKVVEHWNSKEFRSKQI